MKDPFLSTTNINTLSINNIPNMNKKQDPAISKYAIYAYKNKI